MTFTDTLNERIIDATGSAAPSVSDPLAFQLWLTNIKETNPDLFGDIASELDRTIFGDTATKG